MSAGTLKLTNNSTAVVGTGTAFTTDLASGDFIVVTIGGILYTLPVDAVASNAAATIVSPFTGPTTTGAAWAAVPRKSQNQVTADLVAQSAAALRGMNNDKANWQRFYSAPGDITITLPDGTVVSGPSWEKMSELVGSSFQMQTGFYSGSLNDLKTPGIWSVTTPFTSGPTDVAGICEVIPRINNTGLIQRYTTIATGAVNINRTWQRTLTASTWSAWELLGAKALNDLGIGLNNMVALSAFDWQQFDFTTIATYLVSSSVWTNPPADVNYPASTQVSLRVDWISSSGTVIDLTLMPNMSGNTNYRIYKVRVANAKGGRTFTVRQFWTNADIIPMNSGGLGANTPAGGRTALGLGDVAVENIVPMAKGGTGATTPAGGRTALQLGDSATKNVGTGAGTVAAGDDARLNSLEGKSGGTMVGQIVNTPSTSLGETKTAPYNTFIQYSAALPLFTHVASSTIQKTGGVGALFTLGFSFGGYIGGAGTADTSGPMLVCSDGMGYTKFWNFANGSGGINTSNGGILPSGSDARLKMEFAESQPGALQRILSIVSWEFNWIGDGRRDRGYIAQQLREIDPLYVFEAGGDDPDHPILNVSHHALISDLACAVKELHEQNVTQLDEITSLRQELDELNEKVNQLIAK